MNPDQMLYAESHEWVSIDDSGDGKVAVIGITDFAVEQLTDVVFLELPTVGAEVSAGDQFGEVESVKAVSSLYSPVTGTVLEVNEQLPDELEKLNDDPFGAGWVAKVKVTDESSLEKLMDRAAYQKQCEAEG